MNLLRMPVPNPRQFATLVLVALSVGVVTGRALHSATASGSPTVMAQAPPAHEDTSAPQSSGATLAPPTGNARPEPAPAPSPEPATPAPEPEPAAPAPAPAQADPAPEPAQPEPEQPAEDTKQLSGTVVLANPDARSYTLATDAGDLIEVHVVKKKKLPETRALLDSDVVDLDNGTEREAKRTSQGTNGTAKLRGTVTYVSADKLLYVLSSKGASLVVHSAAGRRLPALLDLATVGVHFDDDDKLTEDELETSGKATGAVDLHGKVGTLDDQTRALTLPADDLGESEQDLTIAIPDDVDVEGLAAGQVVAATATLAADGSYSLASWRRDDDARRADQPLP